MIGTFRRYRQLMADKNGYRKGVVYRSRREEIAAWSLIVAACIGFGAIAATGFAWPVVLVLNLCLATVLGISWLAWIAWGRDKFPQHSP